MTEEFAGEIFQTIKKLGCHAVHIGGGEPLLHPEKLFPILKAARDNRIYIEYIETNSSWYKEETNTDVLLKELLRNGVDTLLISIDPFHNEYIPFCKVKGLIRACERTGMSVFPWLMEFWGDLDAMGDSKTHSLEEYNKFFGPDYQINLMRRYHLNLRGRALQTFKKYLKTYPLQKILAESGPCMELTGTGHFHIDLYGNYIPQSCAGMSIELEDLPRGAEPEKYPVISTLYSSGIKGLYDYAVKKYGFVPKENYTGKCELCYEIRRHLVIDCKLDLPDMKPKGHYLYM